MPYRDFVPPPFSVQTTPTTRWMQWLEAEGVLHSVTPRPRTATCRMCFGPVGQMWNGEPFTLCADCNNYRGRIDAFVPITYSLDSGLESMLHRYKDWEACRWMGAPLGSLIYSFLADHKRCIENQFGQLDLAVAVPSNNQLRTFNHLFSIVTSVEATSRMLPWRWDILSRDFRVERPPRKTINAAAYWASGEVQGKCVLLLDDTWTTGASMISAAFRLKQAGAYTVVGLTLGRQLHTSRDYCNNLEIVEEILARGPGRCCVLCAP